ncbi:mono/diheme cytochrome c family protein [Cerasibacillus quisquiliarum]|uniref:Cytochrome c n=1 Tax=Cerasibacillus quisquiliarum TaxID=227865 RepID=A0A511UZA0_9BACI|nr:cytochrome c [Cerasibacillus quisquiliarum]MBB5145524.1 mono/diheme cytochrome c family protein [Cerasibacillus quisquiliarum]GEN31081.1 cytochrome c [Cerasibacillus quisquiliarum]
MKRNPLIPYGIIAIIGIIAIVIVSGMGVSQREAIQADQNGEGKAEEVASDDPEALYEANCLSCHGADLGGGMGPGLTDVGSKMSTEEISEIIQKGRGSMPPVQVSVEEADTIAEWLSEKK